MTPPALVLSAGARAIAEGLRPIPPGNRTVVTLLYMRSGHCPVEERPWTLAPRVGVPQQLARTALQLELQGTGIADHNHIGELTGRSESIPDGGAVLTLVLAMR